MKTLNSQQSARQQEKHVCPLQEDIIRRLIERFSNPGEIVFDPFGGICSVPYFAIHMGRIGWSCELNQDYWRDGVGYCEMAESQRHAPTLFDLADFGAKVITNGDEPEAKPKKKAKVKS